jgi:hypothetical protein
MERLVDIIRNLAAPGSWEKEGGAYINTYRDILIVRHKSDAHRQIAHLLEKLDIPWTKSPQILHIPVVGDANGRGNLKGGGFFNVEGKE